MGEGRKTEGSITFLTFPLLPATPTHHKGEWAASDRPNPFVESLRDGWMGVRGCNCNKQNDDNENN